MNIRFALPGDAQALVDIYAQYMDTAITFEYETPSVEEFARRIREFGSFYPYIVWEEAGHILGYAYAHRIWERAAYQWSAEVSIYLDKKAAGAGRGSILYGALLELLKLQGVRTAFALVTSANPASEALHSRMGFARTGVMERCGYKLGRWHDVIYFEKTLRGEEGQPASVTNIHSLEGPRTAQILKKYSAAWSGESQNKEALPEKERDTGADAKGAAKQADGSDGREPDGIRTMTIDDYDQVHALWMQIKGFGIRSVDDSREGVARFLERNPGCCTVAVRQGRIVGAILCGHDGRQGSLYHVCVHPDWRQQGIGKSMVVRCMEALKAAKVNKVTLIAFTRNDVGNVFWKEIGWTRHGDLNYYDFILNEENITAFNQ